MHCHASHLQLLWTAGPHNKHRVGLLAVRQHRQRCTARVRVVAGGDEDSRQSQTSIKEREAGTAQRDLPSSAKPVERQSQSEPGSSGLPFGALLALASCGVIETAYLTLAKLSDTSVFCPAGGGCGSVLSSGYGELFGLPLPLFGCLAYGSVATLSAWGLQLRNDAEGEDAYAKQSLVRLGLLSGATLLATTSALLMYILFSRFAGQSCTWCLTSAGLSFSIAAAVLSGISVSREVREFAGPGVGLAAATLLALTLGFGDVQQANADIDLPFAEPQVTTSSPPKAVALAKRLKAAGAQMYGAFWCSHCYDQKQAFGKQAMAAFPYVECFPEGFRKGVSIDKACTDADIQGFPTWVIGGQKLEGDQTFQKLEQALQAVPSPE